MASIAQEEKVKITINDVEVEVPKGELIVESVKRLGLEIPVFCYHKRLKPVGMCRMCLVEVGFKQEDGSVRKMPKPQAGCTLPAADNMVIYTDSQNVHEDRRGVLEFLLVNHPLDCPICDRGGECPLQNNTMAYGPSTSRFIEMKRHLPKAYPLSEYVTLDLERCIQCGRCVRFTQEISGDHQLAFRFRGAEMQPSTFQLTDFESKFSGNVIEICPVGALTNAKYRFRARPWDLETKPAICSVTPCGTNIWLDYRSGKFVRINGRTNEAVNEEWTADRCKFGHEFYNDPKRLTIPHQRVGNEFKSVTWSEAYQDLIQHFSGKGAEVACLISPTVSNEGLYSFRKLFDQGFGSELVDFRSGNYLLSPEDRLENRFNISSLQTQIAEYENQDAVLILGASLADEQPMTFLRIRKGWFNKGTKVVVATPEANEADSFAHVILRYKPGTEDILVAGLANLMGAGDRKFSAESVAEKTGVSVDDLKSAAEALNAEKTAFVTTYASLDSESGQRAYECLGVMAHSVGAKFSCLGAHSNSQGAYEILGGSPCNTREILEQAKDGQVKALFLVGYDPLEDFSEQALAEAALESVDFLVYMNGVPGESAAYASLILPMAFPAEQDGTYISCERRVQRMEQILATPGESKAAWRVATELMLRIKPGTPAFNPREIMQELGASDSRFCATQYEDLTGEGVILAGPELGEVESSALAKVWEGV